jgi:hypothetical protein
MGVTETHGRELEGASHDIQLYLLKEMLLHVYHYSFKGLRKIIVF